MYVCMSVCPAFAHSKVCMCVWRRGGVRPPTFALPMTAKLAVSPKSMVSLSVCLCVRASVRFVRGPHASGKRVVRDIDRHT